jgi:hypothetical protein
MSGWNALHLKAMEGNVEVIHEEIYKKGTIVRQKTELVCCPSSSTMSFPSCGLPCCQQCLLLLLMRRTGIWFPCCCSRRTLGSKRVHDGARSVPSSAPPPHPDLPFSPKGQSVVGFSCNGCTTRQREKRVKAETGRERERGRGGEGTESACV